MAYEVKYRCEWTDIQEDDWKVDILEDAYAGAISAMTASGSPLTVDYLTPGDDLTLSPIKGSMATLRVECTTNFEYIGLYDEEDLVRPVNVYKNEVLYWAGWLSNEYTEPYDNVPYTVDITASDALGILKNIAYKDEGDDYTGRETETTIILEILGKIGHTQFTEYCNLYEDRMDDAVDDSPFDQVYIDNDLFIDADCYSVLHTILLKYNAVIRQKNGGFIIYRPTELLQGTVYGRIITAVSTTGTSITPDHVIDREGLDLIDVEGGVLMYKPPMSTFTANQDYGNKESWLKNHKFNISTWVANKFENWTHLGVQPLSYEPGLSGEADGIEMMPDGTGYNYYCKQTFATNAKESADILMLSIDYRLIKLTAGAQADVTVVMRVGMPVAIPGASWYLEDDLDGTASWTNDVTVINIIQHEEVPHGIGSWQTLSWTITGLPADGPLDVTLYASDRTNVRVGYKNIRFVATSDVMRTSMQKVSRWKPWANMIPPLGLIRFFGGGYRKEATTEIVDNEEIIQRNYTVDNAVQGEEGKQTYNLGDCENTNIVNVLEQYLGALAIEQGGSLSQTATDFVLDLADDYAALVTPSVLLTSSGSILYFTSATPGANFTGATSIVNATGTLAGTASTVTANAAGTAQVETITLSSGGAGDTADVYIFGINWEVTYNTSLTQTAADFVTAWAADLVSFNVTLTSDAEDLIFTETSALGGFEAPTIINTSGTLTGTVYHTQAATAAVARVDRIILSGTSGTATVTCHANAETATFNTDTVLDYTASWHTRGNTEALPLAELIAEEVAGLYSKGRQFIQLSMYELTESLDILKNLQDPLNMVGLNNRVFAFNRGSLDAQMREWTIDIIEIGDKFIGDMTGIKYAYLYNWYVATDVRDICADGWHIPTLAEHHELQDYYGGEMVAGSALKEAGTTHWDAPNSDATNESNFNLRGAGERDEDGVFAALRNETRIWAATEINATTAYAPMALTGETYYADTVVDKNYGQSVRPIKDSTSLSHGSYSYYVGNDGKMYRTICIGTQEWLADNLAETLYRTGAAIPNVTDNGAWAALDTGARCAYNNDESNVLI